MSHAAGSGEHLHQGFRWLVLMGVWLIYCTFGLTATSIAPLVNLIETDLDLSHAAMGSIMGAWQLVYIVSAVPCGMLLDRVGARWALILGVLLISASGLARGLANDYWTMLAAVMCFGLGGPIISAGAPKVIARWFEGQSRGLAMGIYMTGPAVGGIVSLTLTHSVLLPAFDQSWRAVMFLWAGFGLVSGLAWYLIASHPVALAVGNTSGSESSLPQGQVLKLLLKEPTVRLLLLMSVGVFLFNHGLNNWLPELLHNGGMSVIDAGYWAAIPTVIGIAGALLIPRLATPGRRFNILISLSLCAAGASLLLHFNTGLPLFTGLLLQGIARSSLMTVLILTLVELPGIGDRYAGVASGLFFSAAEVGGVLGPVSLGLLYDVTGQFTSGLYVLTGIALLLALSAFRLKRLAGKLHAASA